MSAAQRAEARGHAIPTPVLMAVAQAAEFARDWPAALVLLENVLSDMHDMAAKDEPLDPAYVVSWRQQLAWMLQRLDGDCDLLRVAVREAGFGHLLGE